MKRHSNIFIVCIAILILSLTTAFKAEQDIKSKIESLIGDYRATVGVGVITDTEDVLFINDSVSFPTMSVFKFHLALAVLDQMDRNRVPLDSMIEVKSMELLPNTYSPLRDESVSGDLTISLAELLRYSVSLSDNNACDILLRYVGGTSVVEDYIKNLGIKDISIKANEEIMHQKFENSYLNHTTPSSMVKLIRMFENTALLSSPYKDFLIKTMIGTTTGANKLKGQLPDNVIVGHKTGSSDRNSSGMKIGDNDAGFVYLADGRKYYIALFIKESYESDDVNAKIIASISKLIYEELSR